MGMGMEENISYAECMQTLFLLVTLLLLMIDDDSFVMSVANPVDRRCLSIYSIFPSNNFSYAYLI